jgi:hypothetical protein
MTATTANDFVHVLCRGGSNIPLTREVSKRTEQLLSALIALLESPQGARIDAVDGALDYLPRRAWRPLVEAALDAFSYAFWCDDCKVSAFFRQCC